MTKFICGFIELKELNSGKGKTRWIRESTEHVFVELFVDIMTSSIEPTG